MGIAHLHGCRLGCGVQHMQGIKEFKDSFLIWWHKDTVEYKFHKSFRALAAVDWRRIADPDLVHDAEWQKTCFVQLFYEADDGVGNSPASPRRGSTPGPPP
eukprot:3313078-Karenia_brevis.AAC.1